ncbi:MAG TPA: Druantia anti-phage system protein DruA [Chloroflexota bacterium]|nr:Druantia anti-phage system protein DruA [Chloroflexota bacterium]
MTGHHGTGDGRPPDPAILRAAILRSLEDQGFTRVGDKILPPSTADKEAIRRLHLTAVRHAQSVSRSGLISHQNALLDRIADGTDVDPEHVHPTLVEVESNTEDELLFRFARLHWAIPVSFGYGRRLRFLVVDRHNQKLMGILGLGDPVVNLPPRDKWIGWDAATRDERLHCVMDAFVLGAVPPYSQLLVGKLIALLATSREVRGSFEAKYEDHTTRIRRRKLASKLVLITTTSALGRSSVYNRLRHQGRTFLEPVGYTRGTGEFHFSNGLYSDIRAYAAAHCRATERRSGWGRGFRNRREVVRKVLSDLGLSKSLLSHGVPRQVFVAPLAINTKEVLSGSEEAPTYFDDTADDLFQHFRARWLLPRAKRDHEYTKFRAEDYALWE